MFYDNLKAICDAKNIKMTPLVASCGGAKGSISNWKQGASPNSDIVAKIAVHLNVSTDMLIFGKDTNLNSDEETLLNNYRILGEFEKSLIMERASTLAELQAAKKQTVKTPLKQHLKQSETKAEYIYLPYPDSPASAGTGEYLDSDAVEELQVPATNLTRQADYALSVHGDSMEPSYHDGDIVLVSKSDALSIGDIGIFVVNGEGYIKEYGGDRLISINNKYGDIVFIENDRCECQGKVIGKL